MIFAFYNGVVEAATDFEHAIVKIPDPEIRGSDAIILRVGFELWQNLIKPSRELLDTLANQKKLIQSRLSNITIIVIPFASEIAAPSKKISAAADLFPRKLFAPDYNTSNQGILTEQEINALRSQDLRTVLQNARSRCIMCSAENYHFALPSGAHASQFIRLAEAFEGIETVDQVAYWIAVGIAQPLTIELNIKRSCLIVDNPSLLVLGLRTEAILGKNIDLQCIPNYPTSAETGKAINDLLTKLSLLYDDITVVISVASTGKLKNFVEDWSIRLQRPQPRIVALYSTIPLAGLEAFCNLDLPGYEHYASGEPCRLCNKGSHAVSIHGSTYLVGYKPAHAIALPPKPYFEPQHDFLVRYGKIPGALRVHYDDPNELAKRHHSFYVDVASLLDNEQFTDELIQKLKSISPTPDLIICPSHQAGSRIAKVAKNVFGCPIFMMESTFSHGSPELKLALAASSNMLILDDIFITGSRLDQLNRNLREDSSLAPALKNIDFFTIIAAPDSQENYQRAVKGLTSQHSGHTRKIGYLYQFVLPRWHSSQECPWCREKNILEALLNMEPELDDPLADRLSYLNDTKTGLTDNCFSTVDSEIAIPTFGDGSQVLPKDSTVMQLTFACASAIQQLRTHPTAPLNPISFPAPRYLAERVFSRNYTERLLWLALLRSLKSAELEEQLKEYLTKIALKIDDEEAKPYLHRELAIAALDGKLTAITAELSNFFTAAGLDWERVKYAGYVAPVSNYNNWVKESPRKLPISQFLQIMWKRIREKLHIDK